MKVSISEIFQSINFYDLLNELQRNDFFEYLFPFLLSYSLLFTILSFVKIFQSKDGKPINSIISIISFIVSMFAIKFELSPGNTIADIMQTLFPNISGLTIGVLALYIIGSLFGLNFFEGLFSKRDSAFIFIAIGGIGLASVLFYVGIAMGFWDYELGNMGHYWNFTIALFIAILGIVFIAIGMIPLGILFIIIVITFITNGGQDNILTYFIDPFIFIISVFVFLFSMISTSEETQKGKLAKDLRESNKTLSSYEKTPEPYKNKIHDISDTSYQSNLKKWEKKYGGEDWKR